MAEWWRSHLASWISSVIRIHISFDKFITIKQTQNQAFHEPTLPFFRQLKKYYGKFHWTNDCNSKHSNCAFPFKRNNAPTFSVLFPSFIELKKKTESLWFLECFNQKPLKHYNKSFPPDTINGEQITIYLKKKLPCFCSDVLINIYNAEKILMLAELAFHL